MAVTSVIEIIKEKIAIADEISLVISLHRSGKTLKGLCPFHNERTPSFYVYPENQTWHCFGCHESGDIFTFVQRHQGLDFREALVHLAEKAGVQLEEAGERSEEAQERSIARERLLKMNEEALLWFHQMLLRSPIAAEARSYVQERGISMDSVIAFSLGYAGEQWDGLSHFLLARGYSEHELVAGGLARWRESDTREGMRDGIYDYFRQRLIFPIRDTRGRVIGFGGRALGDNKPKYLNSPQTLLFEKNTVLYALDMAREAIKQVGQVIIVEGYVDAIIAHQYGTKQIVACIGSAITEKHIQQLKKMTRQVTLALDPDAAGSAATEHGIEEAYKGFDRTMVPVPLVLAGGEQTQKKRGQQPRSMIRLEEQIDAEINVLQLPIGEDPDEFIRRNPADWFYAVSHPLPLIEYYFVIKTANLNLREPYGKSEATQRLLPIIARISDRIKRDGYIKKLSTMIRIEERSLYSELQRITHMQPTPGVTIDTQEAGGRQSGRRGTQTSGEFAARGAQTQEERPRQQPENSGLDRWKQNTLEWEDYLIGLLLQNPGLSPYVCGIINDGDFAGTDTRELYHILNSVYQRDVSSSLQPIEQFVPSALLPAVARVIKSVESKSLQDGAGLVKEATQCATRLKRMRLSQSNTELNYLMQEAIEAGDKAELRRLQLWLKEIHLQRRTIDTATQLQG